MSATCYTNFLPLYKNLILGIFLPNNYKSIEKKLNKILGNLKKSWDVLRSYLTDKLTCSNQECWEQYIGLILTEKLDGISFVS